MAEDQKYQNRNLNDLDRNLNKDLNSYSKDNATHDHLANASQNNYQKTDYTKDQQERYDERVKLANNDQTKLTNDDHINPSQGQKDYTAGQGKLDKEYTQEKDAKLQAQNLHLRKD